MSETKNPGTSVFSGVPDLASATIGGEVLSASDEFFAAASNMLQRHDAEWREHDFTDRGKWMDGWEPRRRRAPGHDWCIVRLGVPGDLVGVDINTCHFTGNHAPYARIDAVVAPLDASAEWLADHACWTTVLEQVPLDNGSHNVFALLPFSGATHVRLSIYPAGGVARLRVHGHPRARPLPEGESTDLASVLCGARAVACSDMYFSRMDNLLLPTDAEHMGDGWETKRSPLPKQDWIIVQLGQEGFLEELLLDTKHFKGNYPESAQVEAVRWPGASPHALTLCDDWTLIVPPTRLGPDQEHRCPVVEPGPWTHLKLTILTDGGIARLRATGRPSSKVVSGDAVIDWLNGLSAEQATQVLTRCCGASRWVDGVVHGRPFRSRAHLHGHSEAVWWHLGDGDWMQAFAHHPRIGADPVALRERFGSTADWAGGEQAGVAGASERTIQELAAGNVAYEARFGHIFIVCASGLTAVEMLGRLTARMPNSASFELRIAAGEQAKITRIRLDKLEIA